MNLYDTMTRSIRPLISIKPKEVTFYSCGPTVYDYPHVGNWTGYIYWDVLARTLSASNYKVNWYMNITDVGHLVSDDDDGEDKLEKGAYREGKTAWDVAKFYTEDFKQGLDALNISIPKNHLVAATDNIPEQIALIEILEKKGYTYCIDDGIYFDSTKDKNYGKLARLNIEGLQAGKRVAIADKKNPTDFALWKFSPKESSRDMEWDSPWGKGFPGWHIECSAMAMKYLGKTIDIHAGGIDHIPVHHTNEIAQCENATNQPFVHYWIHNNHMMVRDEKISKSLQNGITLQDIEKHHYSATAFKLLVLQSHYRTQSNFSWENLHAASQRLARWQSIADLRWQSINSVVDDTQINELHRLSEEMKSHLQDDLDTPNAITVIEKAMDILENNLSLNTARQLSFFFDEINQLLGINLVASEDISSSQRQILDERDRARTQNDWTKADELRNRLSADHIEIDDTPHGQRWSRSINTQKQVDN